MEISILEIIPICFFSYLCGSIPWGRIVGWINGIDPTKHGSGNIGGTNVGRALGFKWGVLVGTLDAFKGALPPIIVLYFLHEPIWVAWLGFLFAAIGGIYSVFQKFRGGKGIAVLIGGLLAFWGPATLIGLLIIYLFILFFPARGKVSVASMTLLVILAVIGYFYLLTPTLVFSGIVLLLIIGLSWFRHGDNRKRLAKGEERPINFDPKDFLFGKIDT